MGSSVRPPLGKLVLLGLSPSGRSAPSNFSKSKIPDQSPCLTAPSLFCFMEVFLEATWKPSMQPIPSFPWSLDPKKISPGTTTLGQTGLCSGARWPPGRASLNLLVSSQPSSMGCASPFFLMNKEEILYVPILHCDYFRSLHIFAKMGFPDNTLSETNGALGVGARLCIPPSESCLRSLV